MTTLCIATGGVGMETKKYSDNASYFGGMYLLIFHMKTQNTRKMLSYVVRFLHCVDHEQCL